ncbi:long-chain-fatty-acid--CoA ligase heimdall-like [Haematobia irritans]|uniref:long-chain-fatty-acid--CoA ligase heimdall-like n=1 Tax=Haematobia irritans TaxID=7368 RepID=UPI003F5095B0
MAPLKPAESHISWSLDQPVRILASEESLAQIEPKTIPEFFHECCEKYKNLPAFKYRNDPSLKDNNDLTDSWCTVTYGEYKSTVENTALALLSLDVESRTSVGILATNCPEWYYTHLAAIHINAVSVGIYPSNFPEAVFHVLETSNATVVVVDDTQQLNKIRAIRSRLPLLRAVIQIHGPYDFNDKDKAEGYYRWSDILEMEISSKAREELIKRNSQISPNDCALLIFTSGTVGMPKGVMVSHDAVLFCSQAVTKSVPSIKPGNEVVVTYLPLSHIAAQLFDIFMTMENGATVYFADRNALKGTLIKTFVEARPTAVFGVPRIFEKIQEQLTLMDAEAKGIIKCLTHKARAVMLQYHSDRMEGKPTSYMKYWLASTLTNRIKVALGLDRFKVCFIGGAPVSEELKRFFLSLDLPLVDVFGMSETSGGVVFNLTAPNLQTIGKPVGGVEVCIRNPDEKGEGEIIIRGRTNMMGYLGEAEKTKATVTDDGWILTGDLGYVDDNGYIYINGRIKELIITAGGENIPPCHIEALIKNELPCISNAVVVGDNRKYITVLLTFKTYIDPDTGYPLDNLLPETIEWLQSLDLHYTHLSEMLHIQLPDNLKDFDPNSVQVKLDENLHRAIEEGIKRSNQHSISNAQKVQYFTVLPHDLSIPTGELGPTLKICRNIVHKKYSKYIDSMYQK